MTSSATPAAKRPVQLLFRSKEAVELYILPDTSNFNAASPGKGGITLHRGKTSFHVSNPDGSCVYVHDPNVGLIKCDLLGHGAGGTTSGASGPFLRGSAAVQLAKCSPRGSYLLTWERPNRSTEAGHHNLKVWDARNGSLVKGFSCKKATLNTLQWTHDERYAFHMVTNELHVYDAAGFERSGKVRCKGVASFSLPAEKGAAANVSKPGVGREGGNQEDARYLLTAFAPGSKGGPARVDLLRYPDRAGRESTSESSSSKGSITSGPSLASKSLFDAEEVAARWSPRADAALLLTQTAVDNTGESYYGSARLFLLLENDKNDGGGIVTTVPEAENVVGAEWISNPRTNGPVPFVVISGRMPATATLRHGITAEPTLSLGRAHRNTVDVSPHGRFLACGGYGNLAGGMDFWDRNKGKRIPRRVMLTDDGDGGPTMTYVTMKEDLSITSCSPVVGHQWAPDSRTYLVSTTSPRMNVENGAHLYRYDGSLVPAERLPWENAKYQPDKLLTAEYIPAPFPVDAEEGGFHYYPDRPQSPPPRGVPELKGDAARAALAQTSAKTQESDVVKKGGGGGGGAYVPPAARRAGGGGAYVPPGGRKGAAGGGAGGGLAERLRREREGHDDASIARPKRAGLVGASDVVGGAPAGKGKNAARREKQRQAKERAEREAKEAEEREKEEEKQRVEANRADPEKRKKKIKKTLKQIDEIRKKREGGAELNDDQRRKLASEEELRRELASLEL